MTISCAESENELFLLTAVVELGISVIKANERRRHSNRRIRHFSLTSVSVDLFHICATWSKAIIPPAEMERVLTCATCFRRAFGPLTIHCIVIPHAIISNCTTKQQHRKHRVAQITKNEQLSSLTKQRPQGLHKLLSPHPHPHPRKLQATRLSHYL